MGNSPVSISALLSSHGRNSLGATSAAGAQLDAGQGGFASLLSAHAPKQTDSLPTASASDSSNPRLAAQQKLATTLRANETEQHDLGTLQFHGEQSLRSWHELVSNRLTAHGISLDEPLKLLVRPSDGRIVVQGDHPQKTEIEALLNDDPELASAARGVCMVYDLLRSARRHQEFAKAYEQDPVAAVQMYAHLFDEQTAWPLEFRLDSYGAELVG